MTLKIIFNNNPAEYNFDEIKKCMIEYSDYDDEGISDEDVWNRIYMDGK